MQDKLTLEEIFSEMLSKIGNEIEEKPVREFSVEKVVETTKSIDFLFCKEDLRGDEVFSVIINLVRKFREVCCPDEETSEITERIDNFLDSFETMTLKVSIEELEGIKNEKIKN